MLGFNSLGSNPLGAVKYVPDGVSFGVIKTNGPTGGATIDHEIAGFGTPTAAIVIWNKTANPPSTAKEQTIGFYDGTRTRSMGIDALSGAGTTDTWRASHESEIVPNTHYGAGRATVSGWSTNGITIVWDSMTVAWDVTIILFKRTLNVRVDTAAMSLAGTTITAPGFQPDLVFTLNNGAVVPYGGYQPHAIMSMGVTHNSSTGINQGMIAISSPDAYSTNENVSITRDNASFNQIFGSETYYGYLDNFSANGFDVTTSADSGTDELIYLAIELPDQDDAFVGTLSTPTTATTKSMTGFGFEPVGVGVLASHNPTINTLNSTTSGSLGFGFSYHNGTGFIESVQGYSIEDTTGTSNVSDIAEAKVINLQTHTDTISHVANIDSFDSDGVTFDFTTTEGTALDMVVWGVGDSTATGGSDGNANGSLADISVGTLAGSATGIALATGLLAPVLVTAPDASASVDAFASGLVADISVSTVSGTGSGDSLASSTLADVSVSTVSSTATGDANISGSLSDVTVSTLSATPTGSANASGIVSDVDVSTVQGSSIGSAEASGVVADVVATPPNATASAEGTGNASGLVADVSVSTVSASASGDSSTSGTISDITVSTLSGQAYVTGNASGTVSDIAVYSISGSANGDANTSTIIANVVVTPPNATAGSVTNGSASGSIADITTSTVSGSASGGAGSVGEISDIVVSDINGFGTGDANGLVILPDILVSTLTGTAIIGFIPRDAIRFPVFMKRSYQEEAFVTTQDRKNVKIKRTLRNKVEL